MKCAALVLSLLVIPALLPASTLRDWNDTTRDVYIDGRLDRSVQALSSASPRMLALVCGDEVVILDVEAKSVARSKASELTFAADRTTAKSASELPLEAAGTFVRPDGSSYLTQLDGHSILVVAHQSKSGPMSIEELWQTVPVWRAIAEQHEPDPKAVEQLRAICEPVQLQVVLATWCGDSKYYVPRLLKAVEKAANPNVTIELVGIGPDFTTPMATVQQANVTNVPTVIVQRNGRELGRFVETPAGATVEADVAELVAGKSRPHPGRIARGEKLAEGTYALRDSAGKGTETFTVYAGEKDPGIRIVHSVVQRGEETTESWTSFDAKQKPLSAEVTMRAGGRTTRVRCRRDGERWTSVSRGASGGIIEQTVGAPSALITPATITWGWLGDAREAFVIRDDVSTGIGAMSAVRARVKLSDADLRVPQMVRMADGGVRKLTSYSSARK